MVVVGFVQPHKPVAGTSSPSAHTAGAASPRAASTGAASAGPASTTVKGTPFLEGVSTLYEMCIIVLLVNVLG